MYYTQASVLAFGQGLTGRLVDPRLSALGRPAPQVPCVRGGLAQARRRHGVVVDDDVFATSRT